MKIQLKFLCYSINLLMAVTLFGCDRQSHAINTESAPQASNPSATSGQEAAQAATSSASAVDVLTYHNDNARTGQNLDETVLTPGNVNPAAFGKVGFLSVEGKVDAEPLYASNVTIGGTRHNVVFVVTEHDLAYAFDADTFAQLWRVSLLGVGETPSDKRGCSQVKPEIGVTSTPVINLGAGRHGTMYLVALSKNHSGKYFQRLHALDISTGAELSGGPRTVEAEFPGSGAAGVGDHVIFDPKQYEERAALLLVNGVVYTSWASHCDHDPYTGWVIGYNASTLNQVAVLNLTPKGSEGAVWMSGTGPAADTSGNIYLLVGNGTFDTVLDGHGFPSRGDFGNAFVKIATSSGGLKVSDYFAMHDTVAESNNDTDLGSGGALLLPDMKDSAGKIRRLAVGAGKDTIIYVVDCDSMGKFNPENDSAIYQEVPNGPGQGEFAMPAYFDHTLYYGFVGRPLQAFPLANARLASSPSSMSVAQFAYPGTTPSISANGGSNGIVWAVEAGNERNGILHAYDASSLSRELYNSNQAASRDQFLDNKFITPMIAGGKVYVGTPSGVIVFGILHGR